MDDTCPANLLLQRVSGRLLQELQRFGLEDPSASPSDRVQSAVQYLAIAKTLLARTLVCVRGAPRSGKQSLSIAQERALSWRATADFLRKTKVAPRVNKSLAFLPSIEPKQTSEDADSLVDPRSILAVARHYQKPSPWEPFRSSSQNTAEQQVARVLHHCAQTAALAKPSVMEALSHTGFFLEANGTESNSHDLGLVSLRLGKFIRVKLMFASMAWKLQGLQWTLLLQKNGESLHQIYPDDPSFVIREAGAALETWGMEQCLRLLRSALNGLLLECCIDLCESDNSSNVRCSALSKKVDDLFVRFEVLEENQPVWKSVLAIPDLNNSLRIVLQSGSTLGERESIEFIEALEKQQKEFKGNNDNFVLDANVLAGALRSSLM